MAIRNCKKSIFNN